MALEVDTFKDHEVLRVVDLAEGKAMAMEILTAEGDGATFISVHGPDSGGGSWAPRSSFWAEIQMYATARSRSSNGQPVFIGGDFIIWLDSPGYPTTKAFLDGWAACCFAKAHTGAESMVPCRFEPSHQMDSLLMNLSTLPCGATESLWRHGVSPSAACLLYLPSPSPEPQGRHFHGPPSRTWLDV